MRRLLLGDDVDLTHPHTHARAHGAWFALLQAGNVVDTFRMTEALDSGAIPVVCGALHASKLGCVHPRAMPPALQTDARYSIHPVPLTSFLRKGSSTTQRSSRATRSHVTSSSMVCCACSLALVSVDLACLPCLLCNTKCVARRLRFVCCCSRRSPSHHRSRARETN